MTRYGLFLIENGRVGPAVRHLRWTEALLQALGRIDGISQERELVGAHLSSSLTVFAFTSTIRRREA